MSCQEISRLASQFYSLWIDVKQAMPITPPVTLHNPSYDGGLKIQYQIRCIFLFFKNMLY